MECAACHYSSPINRWITVKDQIVKSNTPNPRINYYTIPGSNQYISLYACPKCGTVRIRKVGDR